MFTCTRRRQSENVTLCQIKGPATRNDFVNDIVNDARAGAIFATLKAIVDDETSTISLRVTWPLLGGSARHIHTGEKPALAGLSTSGRNRAPEILSAPAA